MTPALSAVILAAGLSTRMGGPHKLLLEIGGEPMIRRTARAVLAAGAVEIVIVTGHRAAEIEGALAGLPLRFVHNPNFAEGQSGSVVIAAAALHLPCDGVMIVLGDQPLLTAATLRGLAEAWVRRPAGRSILVPMQGGARGNPVIFAATHIPAITSGGLRVGCRRLIEDHPEAVFRAEMADEAFTRDCDTPEEYAALHARLALAPEAGA